MWDDQPFYTSNPRHFDIEEYHPKMETVRKLERSIVYITKEDQNPLSYPQDWDWPALLQASRAHRKLRLVEVATLLRSGSDIRSINEEYPDIVMTRRPQLEDYQLWMEEQNRLMNLNPWVPPILGANPQENQIASWLTSSVRNPQRLNQATGHRLQQLWIWGPSGVGKTFLCWQLSQMLDTYWFPLGEDFHNLFNNNKDLIVMDEYTGNLKLQQMNGWCQGYTFSIRTKGGQTIKNKNIPIIVTSNNPPEDFHQEQRMRHPAIFDAYLSRFLVVHVTGRISLFN